LGHWISSHGKKGLATQGAADHSLCIADIQSGHFQIAEWENPLFLCQLGELFSGKSSRREIGSDNRRFNARLPVDQNDFLYPLLGERCLYGSIRSKYNTQHGATLV
jgi:hypothetical protein